MRRGLGIGSWRAHQDTYPEPASQIDGSQTDRSSRDRSPGGTGPSESFNGRMRHELLNGEIFYSLREAQIIIEEWRKHYNTKRPHSALGYRPPAPETIIPMDPRPITR